MMGYSPDTEWPRGRRYRRARVGSRDNEASRQEAIVNFLVLQPDTWAWRMETNGSVRRNGDGSFRMTTNKYGRGKADVGCAHRGLAIAFEVKRPAVMDWFTSKNEPEETLSPNNKRDREQLQWLTDFAVRGRGWAFLIHTVEEAERALQMIEHEQQGFWIFKNGTPVLQQRLS